MKTFAQVDLSALHSNYEAYRQILSDKTQIIAVVKADAYGHGVIKVCQTLLEQGASMLAVAEVSEGAYLREHNIKIPILVMGGMLPGEMGEIVENNLIPTVFSTSQIKELEAAAILFDKEAKFHLKVETGMNRLGVRPGEELEEVLDTIEACRNIRFSGVYSHFANVDEIDKTYAKQQYRIFTQAIRQIRKRGFSPKMHVANSAAAASCDFARLDYVRIGVGLYGLQPEAKKDMDLTPVMAWKTKVVHVKEIKAGETVSYGRRFTATKPTMIATIPVGYADGYRRALSNKGKILIKGQFAPVVGSVCMDHFMADVTDIAGVEQGDEVVLLGMQGDRAITAQDMADWLDTIHYEIVTCVGKRVPRVYIDDNEG